jgi:hypothetical protein
MTSYTSIGQVRFIVVHLPSEDRFTTTINFEERGQDIYYCWTIKDKAGSPFASKCLPISKCIIVGNRLDFCISHAKESINNYQIGRQKIFLVEVIDRQEP